MYAKFSKCKFLLIEVKFLGHVVSASGVSIDPEKVKAVMSWERSKLVFEILNFLGLAGGLLSRPKSRPDPNGGSEPSSGRETMYWDSLQDFFFFELIPVGYGPHL